MKKKLYILFFIIFIILIIAVIFNKEKTAGIIKKYSNEKLYNLALVIFDSDRSHNRLNNDYNKVFLPNTQQEELKFTKINLGFLERFDQGYFSIYQTKTFYIEYFDNKLFFASKDGKIYYSNITELDKHFKIENNLNKIIIKDILIKDEQIFLSAVSKIDDCLFLNIYVAKLNLTKINFQSKFKINECKKDIQSGKLIHVIKDKKKYLYMSTASEIFKRKDENSPSAQDDNSLWGKIISIDINNWNNKILTKGHRNILGLYNVPNKNIILSTENGPKGGDEINKIIEGLNYGWDIASYGKKYLDQNKNHIYLDHEEEKYQEPIFSFIPSIGISQISMVDDNFKSPYWHNNFLIGSLQNKHLLRVKLDRNFDKVLFVEEIFINERIRDVIYIKDTNQIILALENSDSIGILE